MNLWSICSPQSVHEVFASFDRSPAPPHHFNPSGEVLENVTSIVLQLTRSNLESHLMVCCLIKTGPSCLGHMPTNCVLQISYLGCTHTHREECEGRSIPPACFFPLPASLSRYSDSSHVHIALKYSFQKTHQMLSIPMFHAVWSSQYVVQVMKFSETW